LTRVSNKIWFCSGFFSLHKNTPLWNLHPYFFVFDLWFFPSPFSSLLSPPPPTPSPSHEFHLVN
jgi:hypothetical protein